MESGVKKRIVHLMNDKNEDLECTVKLKENLINTKQKYQILSTKLVRRLKLM